MDIFRGRYAFHFLEYFAEIESTLKAHHFSHLIDLVLAAFQQLLARVYFADIDVLTEAGIVVPAK